MVRSAWRASMLAALIGLAATPAWPQASVTGSIAGAVRDTTGAVLPGVTVEVSSPALIEKVRTAVTDDQGQYKILDLRPGVYTVEFSLPGFTTVKREGIELTTGFTATINGEMRVGSLEETITVTGASPVVDTQNVRNQSVLSRNVLETVPAAHTTQGYAALTLGVSIISQQQDVGGNRGESVTASSIHGNRSADASRTLDGMGINTMLSTGGGVNYYYKINDVMAQEVTVTTDGQSAEYETGGIVTNIVPKAGGNLFSLYSNASYADKNFQTSNYSDELRARGLAVPPSVKRVGDFGVGVGGPIKQDKLWFYTGHRRWDALQEQAGQYYNATHHTLFYTPDLGRPAFLNNWAHDHSVRFTWQVNPKNKINYFQTYQRSCTCDLTGTAAVANNSPEASTEFHYDPIVLPQVTWSYTASNRLLFEAGGQYLHQTIDSTRTSETLPSDIGVRELSTGITYGASVGTLTSLTAYGGPNQSSHGLGRFAMSYVTGSHAIKVGTTLMSGVYDVYGAYEIPYSYVFRNQLPVSLTQYATPHYSKSRLKMNLGIFAQDQWTMNRLTLNLGLRYSQFNAFNPEQTRPAGPFTAALNSPRQHNVPNWKDLDPRLGAAYDVFGNGRTAVKMSLGRYVAAMATGLAQANNPANAMVTQATRVWNDVTYAAGDPRRGNFGPDCDLTNTLANGECGALDNQRFGTVVTNTRYAEDVLEGFGVRPYTWQGSVAVQHELRPNVALMVGYFRTWYGNFYVTDNLRVTAADFDPYCVTAPSDARLPNGGGYQICGLADPTPGRFGQVENLVSQASNFGDVSQVFNGVDASINARFGQGGVISGGVSTGQTVYDTCEVLGDSAPAVGALTPVNGGVPWVGNARNCRQTLPWRAQTQFKFHGIYPLPFWGIQASATFQNLPGIAAAGNYVATNAEIVSSLGRNLAACGAAAVCTQTNTVTDLYEPNSRFEDRLSQLDLRFTKVVRLGRARLRPSFDIYNVFNAGTISAVNATYGATWLAPRGILPGRLVKVGGQFDF